MKYKVCVYAIARNEEQNVKTWLESMQEADEIYVLVDPTSTDKTSELLTEGGAVVKKKLIKPWRFNVARNESLKMVPKDADICVCTDLDERFDRGWRKVLEEKWEKKTNQAIYKYWHNASSVGDAPNIFDYSKIHDRKSFTWNWAVHEYIVAKDKHKTINSVYLDGVLLNHYPDNTKPRKYTSLLEYEYKKDKNSARYIGLLVEDYLNMGKYKEAEKILSRVPKQLKHFESMTDKCMYYKLLIRLETSRQNYNKAKSYCYEALSICDYCKVFYGELGQIYILQDKENELGIANLKKCLSIKESVITSREQEWNDKARIYNLMSIAHYNMQEYKKAIDDVKQAIALAPNNEVYLGNLEIYKNLI